jgi:phosphate transport system substrate-binding protein
MLKLRVIVLIALLALVLPVAGVFAQDAGTIVEVAQGAGSFTTLVSLVEAAGLVDVLNSEGPFTVFAPTDEAFAKLPAWVVEYLGANPEALTRVLTYHVVSGEVMSADLSSMMAPSMEMTSVGSETTGSELDIQVSDTGVTVNGVNVITPDVDASNGVIHVIDTVLIPPFELAEVDPLSVTGDIISAGSSTVFPLTERMAELFTEEGYAGQITVDSIGSGAGIERFCVAGETDIANSSRAMEAEEYEACEAIGRTAVEFRVGTDALTVVVSAENDFVTDLSIEQLAAIYSGAATTWDQVDPSFPAETIQVFSPGSDSGTFDYFVEVILEDGLGLEGEDASAAILNVPGIQLSEDDNVLVQGVEGSPYAIGYFGYAYYLENEEALKAVSVNGVTPTEVTAESGEYPISRPLFIYSDPTIMAEKPQVASFINYYLTNVNDQIIEVGYFPASVNALNTAKAYFTIASAMGGM